MAPKKAASTTPSKAVDATGGTSKAVDATGGSVSTTIGETVKKRTPVIAHIISLCGFAEDSTMVKYIDQQQWTKLFHVTTIGIDEIKDFHTVRDDGVTFEAKPMMIHLRMFKCFLLYYKRKSRGLYGNLDENDVKYITDNEFH